MIAAQQPGVVTIVAQAGFGRGQVPLSLEDDDVSIGIDGSPGEPEIVADSPSVYGPDGLALDVFGNIYVPLVFQDKLVRVNPVDGSVTELATIDDGLDEPASLAFGTQKGDRKTVFVTNFAVMPEDGGAGPALLKIEIGVPGRPLP